MRTTQKTFQRNHIYGHTVAVKLEQIVGKVER